jgi:glycosyltransferase involved in cell wall biosynthesis
MSVDCDSGTSVILLIPAYRPNDALTAVVKAIPVSSIPSIFVVDDGSGPEYRGVFERLAAFPNVTILRHAVNLGKGAALKTGINFILCAHDNVSGIITVDADGQHAPEDILNVCARFKQSPDTMVLGVRSFRQQVPLRSRFGNQVTQLVLRVVLGQDLADTQTGLRAIPRALAVRLLKVAASGYEFELEMLIAAKHLGTHVIQQPIRTIYEPGNPTSHFQPLRDSMRIYFVLLRFSFIAVLTAVLDNFLFYTFFTLTGSIVRAQTVARVAAGVFNYSAVRKAAFLSNERHTVLLPRYVLLVIANAILSYAGIRFFSSVLPIGIFASKLVTETLLFIANFAIQRDFVFTMRNQLSTKTNWDHYYQAVPAFAHLTRRYTQATLNFVMRRYAGARKPIETIVEIGGANSCFLDGIVKEVRPTAYHVVDQNEFGLSLLSERIRGRGDVILHQGDVLRLPDLGLKADVVFSVGLIEHFDQAGTSSAVRAHFDLLRTGGCAIISFPKPTWLYLLARMISETCGLWKFPDERPLGREEVIGAMDGLGEVVFEKTLWPLIFTQHMVVVRKS